MATSFDPITYSAVMAIKSESGAVPVGFGVQIFSTFVIAEDSAGRAYIRSGYLVPADQVPNVPDDFYVRSVEFEGRTIPAGGYISVTYDNGLFVAVGTSNACATSPDGITWTSRTIPAGDYRSVTYDNGLFVAVGSTCATSPLLFFAGFEVYQPNLYMRIS